MIQEGNKCTCLLSWGKKTKVLSELCGSNWIQKTKGKEDFTVNKKMLSLLVKTRKGRMDKKENEDTSEEIRRCVK